MCSHCWHESKGGGEQCCRCGETRLEHTLSNLNVNGWFGEYNW